MTITLICVYYPDAMPAYGIREANVNIEIKKHASSEQDISKYLLPPSVVWSTNLPLASILHFGSHRAFFSPLPDLLPPLSTITFNYKLL